jgi:uncharacterized damage-inducible protein DinB
MSELQRIDDQLHRMFEGDPWHGPSVTALLDGVDAETAAARPLPGAHSIWELVVHMTAWLDIPRRRIEERRAIEAAPEEDWPPVLETGEAEWRAALDRLRQAYRKFRELLAWLDQSRLDETSPCRTYPNYVLFHGVVQHLAYHSGQIALLRKARREAR